LNSDGRRAADDIPFYGDAVMSIIPVIIYAAERAFAAIILYYVIEMISMPGNMKRACQLLIVLIAVLSVLQMAVAGTTTPLPRPLTSPPSLTR